jgi:Cu/Ag efflux protein CusF
MMGNRGAAAGSATGAIGLALDARASIPVARLSAFQTEEKDMRTLQCFLMLALIMSLALAGCGGASKSKKDEAGKVYDIKGKVMAVNPDPEKPTVKLDHEDIPGAMKAMQMEFSVKDAAVLKGIQVGDQVQGKLEKRDSGYVITQLEKR